MNTVEKLEGMILMAINRIKVLEDTQLAAKSLDADEASAQLAAQELGFSTTVLFVPTRRSERIKLAFALREKRWSVARIARVMRTGERNIERWLKPDDRP